VSTTIVLLDDDERIFKAISRLVRPLDALVMSTASADRAYEFCEAGAQILITDINRPDIDVPSLLKRVTLANPSIRKIVLTSYADLEQTIDSINTGKIHRYFTKPWDAEELRSALVEELDAYTAHQNRENESLNFGQKVQSYEQKANFTPTTSRTRGTELRLRCCYRCSTNVSLAQRALHCVSRPYAEG
jgi:DNA-binding NtrC family response regulator